MEEDNFFCARRNEIFEKCYRVLIIGIFLVIAVY